MHTYGEDTVEGGSLAEAESREGGRRSGTIESTLPLEPAAGAGRSMTATSRKLIAALAVAGFALRALVPVGFMPAPGRLFSLELCPDGLPSAMVHAAMHHDAAAMHDHPPDGTHRTHVEHCAFGCASALALVAHAPAARLLISAHIRPAVRFTPQRAGWLLLRIPLPRGPPAMA